MRQLLEPALVHPPFGEPGLYVDLREHARALLFDLPALASLPPRKLLRLSHVFVTHTHMDHFEGFDHLLRVVLGRKEMLTLFGGPGFVDQVEHKLRAYTWNVVHRYDVPLTIEARERSTDGACRAARFDSREAFARHDLAWEGSGDGDVLHEEATLRVRGTFVDHDIPCVAYALEETAQVRLARDRIAELGYGVGPWLRALKGAVLAGKPRDFAIDIHWRDRDGAHAATRPLGELSHLVLDVVPGRRLGYVTDLRFTPANVAALEVLLRGVDQLFIECVFLDADRAHAQRKNHLTARQAGTIARRVGARHVVPFHVSPRYEGREHELVAEMHAAWKGEGEAIE